MAAKDADSSLALSALQRAVANALERKWRLGQYAVIWRDAQVVIVQGKELGEMVKELKSCVLAKDSRRRDITRPGSGESKTSPSMRAASE